jgi:hypothetical protein
MMKVVPPLLPRERSRGDDVTRTRDVTPVFQPNRKDFSTSWTVYEALLPHSKKERFYAQ